MRKSGLDQELQIEEYTRNMIIWPRISFETSENKSFPYQNPFKMEDISAIMGQKEQHTVCIKIYIYCMHTHDCIYELHIFIYVYLNICLCIYIYICISIYIYIYVFI